MERVYDFPVGATIIVGMLNQRRTTGQALRLLCEVFSGIDHTQRADIGHAERVELMLEARRLAEQVQGLAAVLTAEVERHQSSMHPVGTPLTSMLANAENRDDKDAARSVFEARDVARHPHVADAVLRGTTTTAHARGIAKGMAGLPRSLDAAQREQAEEVFLRLAESVTPAALPGKAAEVLTKVAPEQVPDPADEARALEEQRKRALQRRSFRHGDDGDGSIWFKGSLPRLEAAPMLRLLEGYVAAGRRAARESAAGVRSLRPGVQVLREHGGSGVELSTEQRWADALVAMVADHRGAPQAAADRPRIVVRMSASDLRRRAEQAGVLDSGARITAGELRRLCCDADLMPVVLGGDSEILDVGHTQRLVTPAIRKALSLRDGGCVFPQCSVSDAACEAHHVAPWWDGGDTALGNLAPLCPHHHAVVEPHRFNPYGDQWQITFHPRTRIPQVHPPRRWKLLRPPLRT